MKKLLPFLILLFATGAFGQNRIFVKADATGGNNGANWTDAYLNLQNAINHAIAGDSIFVSTGTYTPTGNSFNLKNGVKIYGGFTGTESFLKQRNLIGTLAVGDTTILTNNASGYSIISNYPVLAITTATVLDGFTLSNGKRTLADIGSGGGAINNYGASPTITNCIFKNNKSNYGAWMNEQNSNPIVKHCTFINNNGLYGGAMCNFSSSPVIDSCTFEGNKAEFSGGAMHNAASSAPVISHSAFINNAATTYTATTETGPVVFPGSGGAVANIECAVVFSHCTFTGNKVTTMGDGGAMVNSSNSSAVIDSCTFTNNTTDLGNGGAILNVNDHTGESTAVVISNCTFSGNIANGEYVDIYFNGGFGGAVCNKLQTSQEETITDTIKNCKFLNNTATFGGAGVSDYYGGEKTTIISSLFYGNTAYDAVTGYGAGAAYQHTYGDANIINCVFANNNAAGPNDDGGAILSYGGTLNIVNSTFSNNVSASYNTGSGAISGAGYYAPVTFNVTNSIIYGTDAQQVYADYNASVNYDHSLVKGVSVIAPNLNTDPLFVNAANPAGADGIWGTADDGLALQLTSPAINAGTSDTTALHLPAIDMAGNLRIQNSRIDMGAYENYIEETTLPVTLISFTAKAEANYAKLQWQTASGQNNKGFTSDSYRIYRSGDDKQFVKIGDVPATDNSQPVTHNSFIDKQPLNGNNYYQLVQVDNDGTVTELGVKMLNFGLSTSDVRLFPNPTIDRITVTFTSGKYHSLSLIGVDGKVLQAISLKPTQAEMVLDLSVYPLGVYYIKLVGNNISQVKKMVKQR